KEPAPDLMQRLADHEVTSARRLDALSAAADLTSETIEIVEPIAMPEVIEQAPEAQAPTPEPEPVPLPMPSPTAEAPITRPVAFRDSTTSAQAGDSQFGAPDSGLAALGLPELKPFMARPTEAVRSVAVHDGGPQVDDDIDAIDAVDAELFPIFEEEGQELLPQLASQLRDWSIRRRRRCSSSLWCRPSMTRRRRWPRCRSQMSKHRPRHCPRRERRPRPKRWCR